jgi:hypothetical protein
MTEHEAPAPDLVWSLDNITHKEKAASFLCLFEQSLCVFSSAVSQLYANYSIAKLSQQAGNLVVIPNPYAAHDTFQSIRRSAVIGTGLFIIPGEAVNKPDGLYLMQRSRKTGKFSTMPLAEGINRISSNMSEDNPFLPVITNRDLRELPNRAPILHLHRLDSRKLDYLSSFQIKDISNTISKKIDTYWSITQ